MLHRLRSSWRVFRPKTRTSNYHYRDKSRDAMAMQPQERPMFVCKSTDLFDCAEEEAVDLLQRRPEVEDLERDIPRLIKKFMRTRGPHDGLMSILIQAPRASLAQVQMDVHPHGYHDKQARLLELIDFNDAIDATILVLEPRHRAEFSTRMKQATDRMCRRVGAPCFTNEQWDAIIRGLSREIAVYLVAKNSGFYARMASRTQDALGIDVQIQDPETKRYVNIDIKSPSAFRHRLEQLVKEGRLTEKELLEADERCYALSTNGRGVTRARVVVLSTLADKFGEVKDFQFENPEPMRQMISYLLQNYSLDDGNFGEPAPLARFSKIK